MSEQDVVTGLFWNNYAGGSSSFDRFVNDAEDNFQ